jgi:hypothetical protein
LPSATLPAPRGYIFIFSALLGTIAFTMQLGLGSAALSAPVGSVRLSPPMTQVPADEGPFTVYVVIQDLQHAGNVTYDDNRDGTPDRSIPSEGLGAFEFTIAYNPQVVEFRDAEHGPNLTTTGRSFQCLPARHDAGEITFGCLSPGSNPPGPQGNLTLAAVQFSPRGSGLSPLVLSAEIAGPLGDSAEVDVGGGAVRVEGDTPAQPTEPVASASTTPGATGQPNQTAVPPVATSNNGQTSSPEAGTPAPDSQTATALVEAQLTPGNGPIIDPPPAKNEGSSSPLWPWLIGIAGGVTLGAGGLVALLMRRRTLGSL